MKPKVKILWVFTMFLALHGYGQNETKQIQQDTIVSDSLGILTEALQMEETGYENLYMPSIVPPSPEAANLGLFGQFQLGHFTGTADISIPIYELKGKQLSHSVSLKYNSSGVQVEEISPWVGANWGLIAGGLITQNVRGTTDDHGIFLNPLPQVQDPYQIDVYDLNCYCDNICDAEPDIFIYNFSGYSGKILFDEGLNPITIPRQPITINPDINPSTHNIEGWEIYDDKGFKYYFETITHRMISGNGLTASKAWYLDYVISPDNLDTLTFTYDTYLCNYPLFSISQSIADGGSTSSYHASNINYNSVNVSESNAYINKIESSAGVVVFENAARSDDQISNLRQLDRIKVYDKGNTLVKELKFSYNNTGERLFLTKIEEIAEGESIDLYEFEYISGYLPVRFSTNLQMNRSFALDYWGYYNAKTNNNHLIPQMHTQIPNFTPADRRPDPIYAKRGTLEKIIYPTKGYTKFYYELNKTKQRPLFFGNNIPISSEYEVGGLRITKIEDVDNMSGVTKTKRYDYQNQGQLSAVPIYGYTFESNMSEDACPEGYLPVTTISSFSQAYLNSIHGSHIVYPKVKEIYGIIGENGEDGYSIYEFSTDGVWSMELMTNPPFIPDDGSSSYKAGLLIKQTDCDLAGNRLKEIKNVYSISESLSESIRGLRVVRSQEAYRHFIPATGCDQVRAPGDDEFYLSFYNTISEWQYKSSDTVRIYDPTDESKYVETINTYAFNNSSHQQLSTQATHNSNLQPVVTNYIYPSDPGSGAPTQMYDGNNNNFKHMLSPIIEKRIEVNGQPVSKVHTNYIYDTGKDMVLPSDNDVFPTGNSTAFKVHYSHNNNGNLVEQYKDDDIKTVFLWDATGTYVMARVENANYSQISAQDGKACTYNSLTLFNSLKTLVPDAMITTYTYKPLTGVTQQTDPDGRTTYYEYDSFGRLKLVRDQNNNIVFKNEYHYAGQ